MVVQGAYPDLIPADVEISEQFEAMLFLRNELPINLLQPNVLMPFMLKLSLTVCHTMPI